MDWNTFAIVFAIVGSAVGAAVWITNAISGVKDELSSVKIDMAEIKANLNGHPNWNEVRAVADEKIEQHEAVYHGRERRKHAE